MSDDQIGPNEPSDVQHPYVKATLVDPWVAVNWPIPEPDNRELVEHAHHWAQNCWASCEQRIAEPDLQSQGAFAPPRAMGASREEYLAVCEVARDAAAAKVLELEAAHPGLVRLEGLERIGEVPTSPIVHNVEPAQFGSVVQEVTRTPVDAINRDLAAVTKELAITAGVMGTVEYVAFQQAQAVRGEQITRTADPAERAELRAERDAVAHTFAAGLADKVAGIVETTGQGRDADELKKLAAIHREIAGELRGGEGKDPPDGPKPPSGPVRPDRGGADPHAIGGRVGGNDYSALSGEHESARQRGAEFAEAAKTVGQGVLGRLAEVVMTAEGPQRPEDRLKDANLTQNIGVRVIPTPAGTMTVTGPEHRYSPEAESRAGELSAREIGRVDEASASRGRDDSSKRQEREDGALRGGRENRGADAAYSRLEAKLSGHREALKQDQDHDGAQPDRPSDRQTAAAAFRSFGR